MDANSCSSDVNSLADAFCWARHCVSALHAADNRDCVQHAEQCLATGTLSTTFSGLGTPENANLALSEAIEHALQTGRPQHMPCIWAAEWDNEAQYELLAQPEPSKPCCLFGDIRNFLNKKIRKRCWIPFQR